MKRTLLLVAFVISCISFACAQNWVKDMHDPRVNFYTVQAEYNEWWAAHEQEILNDTANDEEGEKGELWKNYKRWESDMLPLMETTNGVRLGPADPEEKNFYAQQRAIHAQRSGANWSYIGAPGQFDDGTGDSSAGRINCVRFDPVNRNVIYCGAPSGGAWKSVDFGKHWSLMNTDNLPQIGVSDIAVNPLNTNTIFIATGDIANSASLSVGVFKSINGGQTWDTTGLTFTLSQGALIARVLISPLDTNTLYAATNTGVYKSIDGGGTWNKVNTFVGLTGMEFNPKNANTIYAWGTQLYRSVDAGATWATLTGGLPNATSSDGFGVGLTPADTNCIYVLVSDTAIPGQSDQPYKGLYRSLNGGASFTLRNASPDDQGTQGSYDLVVGVSPVNKNVLNIGAVNCEYSTDGGVTWKAPSFVSHVDHHDMRFFGNSGDTVFSADDGGLFMSTDTGNTWLGLSNGMHIGQIYSVASGPRTPYFIITSRQDDGTLRQDSSAQRLISPGDGLKCLIDPLDENHMFGSLQQGIIGSSNNGGIGSIFILVYNWGAGVNGFGAWNTPYCIQGDSASVLYVAKDKIYRSGDGGSNWITLNSPTLPANDKLYQLMAVAHSDPKFIYAANNHHLYRSANGGATFTNITSTLSGQFISLAISESNPREIWVGFKGNAAGLLHSVDSGAHFQAYTTGLPAGAPFYAKCIAPVRESNHAAYVGLANAGGIYYRDSSMTSWMPYSDGLPNVTVDQLEIDYCVNKIRAATYGRDLWESDPYVPLQVPPQANATFVSHLAGCTDTVTFTDRSNFNPGSWQWYFPGGQPSSSTSENPVVVYPVGNTYTATLITSNSYGTDTAQYAIPVTACSGITPIADNSFINVYPNPTNGNFTLSIASSLHGKVDLTVLDNMGRSVYQSSLNKDADVFTTEVSLRLLSTGVYYLKVTTEGSNRVLRLVVERYSY